MEAKIATEKEWFKTKVKHIIKNQKKYNIIAIKHDCICGFEPVLLKQL